jgi:hypothetical protein
MLISHRLSGKLFTSIKRWGLKNICLIGNALLAKVVSKDGLWNHIFIKKNT